MIEPTFRRVSLALRDISPFSAGLLTTAVAALSYSTNLFGAASETVRTLFTGQPDQIVTDALRANAPILGTATPGGFVPYVSQFGGQLQLFRLLGFGGGTHLEVLAILNALALALVVGGLSYLVAKHMFGGRGGLAFGLALALSPWMIMFGHTLYWVPWAWFLPLLITLLIGREVTASPSRLAVLCSALFLAFLFRFLTGYEYASTIVAAASVPIFYFGLKRKDPLLRIVGAAAAVGVTSVAAIALAFLLHAGRIAPTYAQGFEIIKNTAIKRTGTSNPEAFVEEFCRTQPADQKARCLNEYERSLSAPLPVVLAVYSTFRYNIPWLAGPDIINMSSLEPARRAMRAGQPRVAIAQLNRLGIDAWFSAFRIVINMIVIWALIAFAVTKLWRRRRTDLPEAALLVVSAAAPLSWYILAKAHSYAHLQLDFALWMLPFLPFLVAYLCASRYGSTATEHAGKAPDSPATMVAY